MRPSNVLLGITCRYYVRAVTVGFCLISIRVMQPYEIGVAVRSGQWFWNSAPSFQPAAVAEDAEK